MDTRSIDERLRGVYERSAPAVNDAAFRARLRRSTGRRPTRTLALQLPRRHLVLAALSTVVVLAALGFGVSALVERLGRDHSVVVITGDSMSSGPGSGAAVGQDSGAIPAEILNPEAVFSDSDAVIVGRVEEILPIQQNPGGSEDDPAAPLPVRYARARIAVSESFGPERVTSEIVLYFLPALPLEAGEDVLLPITRFERFGAALGADEYWLYHEVTAFNLATDGQATRVLSSGGSAEHFGWADLYQTKALLDLAAKVTGTRTDRISVRHQTVTSSRPSGSLGPQELHGGLVWVRPIAEGTDNDQWGPAAVGGEVNDPSELPLVLIGLEPNAAGRINTYFERFIHSNEDLRAYLDLQRGILDRIAQEEPDVSIYATATFTHELKPQELRDLLDGFAGLELRQVDYHANGGTGGGNPPEDFYSKDWYGVFGAGIVGPAQQLAALSDTEPVALVDVGAYEVTRELTKQGHELIQGPARHLAFELEEFHEGY